MSNTKPSREIKKTDHQKFVMETWKRSQIREADYNPRVITDQSKKKLKDKMKAVGLLQPLVVNRKTCTLVSGHQRLASLDALERWKPDSGKDYELDVSVIDVDDATEKELNVFFNNPSAMGEWDLDKLAGLNIDDGIDFSDMGFEQYDIDMLFDGDSRFSQLFIDDEEVQKTGEALQKVKDARKQGKEKMKEQNAAAFYFTVVFKSNEEKAECLRLCGVPAFEQFVEGSYLMENIRKGGLGRKEKGQV